MKTQTITTTITKHQQSVPTPLLDKIIEEHEQRKHKRLIRRRRMVERYITMHEALKIGARRYAQAFGYLESDGTEFCAMGMIGKVIGMNVVNRMAESTISAKFHTPNSKIITCPECDNGDPYIHEIIMHLNDDHEWEATKIAKWLREKYPNVQTKQKVKIMTTVTEEVDA